MILEAQSSQIGCLSTIDKPMFWKVNLGSQPPPLPSEFGRGYILLISDHSAPLSAASPMCQELLCSHWADLFFHVAFPAFSFRQLVSNFTPSAAFILQCQVRLHWLKVLDVATWVPVVASILSTTSTTDIIKYGWRIQRYKEYNCYN